MNAPAVSVVVEVPWPRDTALTLQILDITGGDRIDPAGAGGPWYCAQDIARITGADPDAVRLVASTLSDPCVVWNGSDGCTWVSAWGAPILAEGLAGADCDLFAEWFTDELADQMAANRSARLPPECRLRPAATAPILTLEAIAVELLATAREGIRRADRAMAHVLRASIRQGLDWPVIATATGLEHGEAVACMDRWPGDPG